MSDDSPRNGLNTVLRELEPTKEPPPEPSAAQLTLLGDQPRNDLNKSPEEAQEDSEGGTGNRGKGRKKGARNKRTEEWSTYILDRHTSPLVFLAKLVSTPTKKIREKYKCTMFEAVKLQKEAAKELAPYLHQKKPLAIHGEGVAPINLILGSIEHQGGDVGEGGLTLEGSFSIPDDEGGE